MVRRIAAVMLLAFIATGSAAQDDRSDGVRENAAQVARWNRFFDALLTVHASRAAGHPVTTTERVGGYGGAFDDPDFYVEVDFRDAATGRLLSRVRRVREQVELVHAVDVYVYDARGRIARDYSATFLPRFRNAPIQTLINLHAYSGDLHAFRQFDASGNRIYEHCAGTHLDATVQISLDESRLPFSARDEREREDYLACFGFLPLTAGAWLDPGVELAGVGEAGATPGRPPDRDARPDAARTLVGRGRVRFLEHDFEGAILDLSQAISLDPAIDEAWFWRGMARGRARQLDAAIADLDVYLERRPGDPVGGPSAASAGSGTATRSARSRTSAPRYASTRGTPRRGTIWA